MGRGPLRLFFTLRVSPPAIDRAEKHGCMLFLFFFLCSCCCCPRRRRHCRRRCAVVRLLGIAFLLVVVIVVVALAVAGVIMLGLVVVVGVSSRCPFVGSSSFSSMIGFIIVGWIVAQHLRFEMLFSTFACADYFGFIDDNERSVRANKHYYYYYYGV